MTLTELRYIVAVAKVKHFGKAAEECCVSQPTLSVGIRKLEEGLGISIFERGRSEVKITPIGEFIINQAQYVLAQTQIINDIALADKDQLKEPIKIASTYTVGKYLFPHLVKQAYNHSPKLTLLLNQDYHEVLFNKLEQQELDLLIIPTDQDNIELSDSLTSEKILQEDFYLLTAAQNKYAGREQLAASDLSLEDLLLLNKEHCLHQHILNLNADWQQYDARVNEFNFDSLEGLCQMVKAKNSATIVPASFIEDINNDNPDIRLIPFTSPKPKRVLSLVWRSNFPRPQVLDILKQCLKKVSLSGIDVV